MYCRYHIRTGLQRRREIGFIIKVKIWSFIVLLEDSVKNKQAVAEKKLKIQP